MRINKSTTPREPKPSWDEVPQALRAKIEGSIGGRVVDATIVWGGYGPSATFVLTTGGGARFFCKGTHPGQTRQGHEALLKERQNYERYPELAAFSPAYRGGADHGDWHMAVLDFAAKTRAVPPWNDDAVRETLELLVRFYANVPSRAASDATLRGNSQILYDELGWKTLLADGAAQSRFCALFEDERAAARWLAKHGEALIALEERADAIGGPQSWLHLDIRSDNLVFAERLWLVDWPLLSYGAVLSDLAAFLPSLEGEGGPSCADALRQYEALSGVSFAADNVATAAAAIAAFFASRAGEPDILQLPRLRWIQKLQLFPALKWMCGVLAIAPPPLHRPF